MTATTATLAARRAGVHRRLYLRISGVNKYLWQAGSSTPPDTGTTPAYGLDSLVCLHAPTEYSHNLDLAEMKSEIGSISFVLDNIRDPAAPTTFYFAKLFAPGLWEDGTFTYLADNTGTAYGTLAAGAATIAVKSTTGFDASGTAYIGQERFSYSGVTSTSFTGCSRGLYPAFGVSTGHWAPTYTKPPKSTSEQASPPVTSQPYSMLGRYVGLYLACVDPDNGSWTTESDNILLWAGYISQSISFDPKSAAWTLTCEPIHKKLENKICQNLAGGTYVNGINLRGPKGLRFLLHTDWKTTSGGVATFFDNYRTYDFPADWYPGVGEVVDAFNEMVITTGPSAESGDTFPTTLSWEVAQSSDGYVCVKAYKSNLEQVEMWITPLSSDTSAAVQCHVLQAMGLSSEDGRTRFLITDENFKDDDSVGVTSFVVGQQQWAEAYHPLDRQCNGSRLYASADASLFWTDQGDYGSARAALYFDEAKLDPYWEEEGYAVSYYSLRPNTATASSRYFTLVAEPVDMPTKHVDGYVVARYDEDGVELKQAYVPCAGDSSGTLRGPFELLLYSLLSTGTSAYNDATYDKCPVDLSVSIPASLVDATSFTDADTVALSTGLGRRDAYLISESESWFELLNRECKLFGFVLVWNHQKLTLQSALGWTQPITTLDEPNSGQLHEFPASTCSSDTVINSYELTFWEPYEQKERASITITDINSALCLGETKQVELTHPGVTKGIKGKAGAKALAEAFVRDNYFALWVPWQTLEITIAPYLLNTVSCGDCITYTSTCVPDPWGDGTLTTSAAARIISLSWDYEDWIGKATIIIYQKGIQPWAPSALVDISAANGGWDSVNKRLTLIAKQFGNSGDSKDGATIASGYKIRIAERCPTNYQTGYLAWAAEVASAFETDGTNLLTLTGALAAWDNAKEYLVTFDDYATAATVSAEELVGTWQADTTTLKLNTSTKAKKYG